MSFTNPYANALQIQDACNLSGVLHQFSRDMTRLCHSTGLNGTHLRNTHTIVKMYLSKLCQLAEMKDPVDHADWREAYHECIARQHEDWDTKTYRVKLQPQSKSQSRSELYDNLPSQDENVTIETIEDDTLLVTTDMGIESLRGTKGILHVERNCSSQYPLHPAKVRYCIRTANVTGEKHIVTRDKVMAEIESMESAGKPARMPVFGQEKNPITFWVVTTLTIDHLRSILNVDDVIVSQYEQALKKQE